MSEPQKLPTDLTLLQLQAIVRKVQEALWWTDDGEWRPTEECGFVARDAELIAGILTDYHLQPVEQEAKEDDE